MALNIDPTGLGGIVAGGELISGLYRTIKANSLRKELMKKPLAKYGEVPELTAARSRANSMAQSGFTAPENAAWQQGLNRSENTAYQHAVDTAPNLAGAVTAGINYSNVNAINTHAMQDATLHRSNIKYADTFANYLQELNNKNIAEQLNMTKAAYGAIGQGEREGVNEIASVPSTFAAIYSAGMGGNNKKGGDTANADPYGDILKRQQKQFG